jgi:hypothetical protein
MLQQMKHTMVLCGGARAHDACYMGVKWWNSSCDDNAMALAERFPEQGGLRW